MPVAIPAGVQLSGANLEALAGELIGAAISIRHHPGLGRLPWNGTIVDETMGTFLLRRSPGGRTIRISKAGLEGTILLGERELPLRGDTLRIRPQDRTKRLLQAGPRRSR